MAERERSVAKNSDTAGNSFAVSAPTISLPKGGGAIRGIGEKFAANPATGTGSLTVPIYATAGRNGFGPHFSLSYDTGQGNGPFGFGWSLSLPAITRKTAKGLPLYEDSEESDVFILSGAEDLMPGLVREGGNWTRDVVESRTVFGRQYAIHNYRPRVEGLFARIERWVDHADPSATFWRSITKDNITSWYGKTKDSRIADPADATRVFSWLICESYDDKGNVLSYRYKSEDSAGVDLSQAQERNRTETTRSAQRHPKRVLYGNRTPYFPDLNAAEPVALPADWCFELVFDYGEHDPQNPVPDDTAQPWACRLDPFSTYRPRFELRTYRLCRRVLMFHHFADEAAVGLDCLVRSTDLTHASAPPADSSEPFYAYLLSVTQTGYARLSSGYLSRSVPPLEFTYTTATVDETVRDVDRESLDNLPGGIEGSAYRWVDLNGEGVSGILSEQGTSWFYKPNYSPANQRIVGGQELTTPWFGPTELVARQPSIAALNSGSQQLFDLSGDGLLDLVEFETPVPGYYERTADGASWKPYRPFPKLPVLDWRNPNLRFIDLTGDGFPDLLLSEDGAFWWHRSLAIEGFGPGRRVAPSFDEEEGPKLVFANESESIFLADMSGDGLSDLVRIRASEICYWPNLGYGLFGAKVTMDRSPRLDRANLFDAARVRLADIDGTGTADLIYFGSNRISLYFNQSGNAWGAEHALDHFPAVERISSAAAFDLLGNGTACLVWSSSLPGNARRPMRYIDLIGGQKPHLLVKSSNNLGAETRVEYAPSTKFYVADKLAGTPWVTRIPFPVHVVERVETYDYISRNRFVSRYAYHHGYFDGVEREFRGFGRVDQWDTEEITTLTGAGGFPQPANQDPTSDVPPVWTKTWFHTGAFFGESVISKHLEREYYDEGNADDAIAGLTADQLEAMLLDDTVLPTTVLLPDGSRMPYDLSGEEMREACRALRGSILRQEIYGLDDTEAADRPYSVAERNYTIEMLQSQGPNQFGVFLVHPRETIDFHYERALYDVAGRKLADPRVSHAAVLNVDLFGNVLRAVAIGYGRRHPDTALIQTDQTEQAQLRITGTESQYTSPIIQDDSYRSPLPAEVRNYELVNCKPQSTEADITNLFRFDELADVMARAGDGAHDLPYEDWQAQGATQDQPYRRLIERVRTLYRKDDLSGSLPLGQVGTLALPFESYKQAFTPELLTAVYGDKINSAQLASVLQSDGQYRDLDATGSYWVCSGRAFFSPDPDAPDPVFARAHFYLAQGVKDPFGNVTHVVYDDPHNLLPVSTQDAVGNVTGAQNDYRVLQPILLTDPNGNRAAVSFDALGLVAGTAVMGKSSENFGDSLAGFTAELAQAQIDAFFGAADPHPIAGTVLARATTRIVYDVDRFRKTQAANPNDPTLWQPTFAATLARETHLNDPPPPGGLKIQVSFGYSDGFGRESQKKVQAEPGPLVAGGPTITPRWVGTGWIIFNNKGEPVRQYEPFFDDTHDFKFGAAVGVSPILFYDPVERVVATLQPDHSWGKAVFDPWRQESWDGNDTVLIADPKSDPDVGNFFQRLTDAEYLPTWYAQRRTGELGSDPRDAAVKTEIHAATPAVAHADALGRTFLSIAYNRFIPRGANPGDPPTEEHYATRTVFDIEGNQREIVDASDRIVMRYAYDMLGTRVYQASMEAGERWMLNNVSGKPIYVWDSLDHQFHTVYDPLQRPTDAYLRDGSGPDLLIGRTIYGESQSNPETNNLRGKVAQTFDQAGIVTNVAYDFKGNLLSSQRQLAQTYKTTIDWASAVALETEVYTSNRQFDALNRPKLVATPDNSAYQPTFNEASLLDAVDVTLRGAELATSFVANIDYDAKGRRTLVQYGNNTKTDCQYDPLTFRLTNLKTTRLSDQVLLQDLSYTYDPVGNVTLIRDAARQTIYFNNQVVTPDNDYTYDATYRLIVATGREHIGQVAQTTWNDQAQVNLPQPGDGQAMGQYAERYEYDAVGNFLALIHRVTTGHGNWTRSYQYSELSQLEPEKVSNRLSSTTIGTTNPVIERYTYDAHGNMTTMPHLSLMQWDFHDQLQVTSRQVASAPETTYYAYDPAGQRVRKVTERGDGTRKNERAYLGGFEIYREYGSDGATVTLERETLQVMDDEQRVALVETRAQGDDGSPPQLLRYQFGNDLGSASLELDDQAQIISYEEYYPYGSTSYQAGRSMAEVSLKRYRYTGVERDEESGLYYCIARYYAPWLSRWLACDPIGAADRTNLYLYARDNPIHFTDRRGKNPDNVTELETQLRDARAKVNQLAQKFGELVTRQKLQEAKKEIWKSTIAEVKRSFTEAEIRQIEKGELKAFRQGSGKRDLVKQLEHAQEKLADAQAALKKTAGELKDLESAENAAQKRVAKLADKVRKVGGNPNPESGDTVLGEAADAESLADADAAAKGDDLYRKFDALEGKKPAGSSGAGAKGRGSGPVKRWRGGSGAAGAGEDVAAGSSRFLRYGARGIRIAGTAALVVSVAITAGTAIYHLSQGDWAAAELDVADFFTLGGASYAAEKTAEGVKAIDEGMKAARALRDWNEGGGVPPPQPGQETQQEREERRLRQQQSHFEHPFGF